VERVPTMALGKPDAVTTELSETAQKEKLERSAAGSDKLETPYVVSYGRLHGMLRENLEAVEGVVMFWCKFGTRWRSGLKTF
jgi:hypothetical protein